MTWLAIVHTEVGDELTSEALMKETNFKALRY